MQHDGSECASAHTRRGSVVEESSSILVTRSMKKDQVNDLDRFCCPLGSPAVRRIGSESASQDRASIHRLWMDAPHDPTRWFSRRQAG
jgi:hypothetical protein